MTVRSVRSAFVLGAVLSLVAAPVPAARADVPILDVQLRAVGSTTVAQGSPFTFRASLRNPGPGPADVITRLDLEAIGSGNGTDAIAWQTSVPEGRTVTKSFSLVSSQWFPDIGSFQVLATITGQPESPTLDFEVTPPTVLPPTLQDVTAQAGVHTTVAESGCGHYAVGAAWADVDGDGDLDLYALQDNEPAQLWINDGAGHFTDEAVARGVTDQGAAGLGAVFADYDNDGDQDLFVANDGPDRLYRNDGTGHFTDVAGAAGVASTTEDVSASWGDYDNDGYLDLYVVSNSPCLPPVFYEQDHLFHNEGDGTFTDQTSLLPASSTFGAGFQAAWFDYDGDGDQDLYLANDRWGPSPDPNHLWRNDGPGTGGVWRFTDVSGESRTGYVINSMGIAVGDPNRDLRLDFAVSNIGGNVLARNEGNGTFTEVARELGVQREFVRANLRAVTWGLAFSDLNLDGWEDLLVVAGALDDSLSQPNQVFAGAGDGTFLDLSALSGADDLLSGHGLALADYDRDGLVDAFVQNRHGSAILYRNVTATSLHWLEVDLTGTVSNRDGCGARLVLTTAPGDRQIREVFCGSVGLSSGSDTVVHFGLGSADRVQRLLIEWPSGRRQVLRNLAVDRLLTVVEP